EPLLPEVTVLQRVFDHIRGNRARVHRVAPNLVPGVLRRGGFGEETHGPLSGRVGRSISRAAHQAGGRGDIDDGPAASASHRRDGVFRPQKDALDVYRHDAVPVVFGGFFDAL